MSKNNWLQRLNPFRDNYSQIKALEAKLDDIADADYKFYDAEPSTSSGLGGVTEFGGIDQIVNPLSLQRIYATETWVYIAVNAIAQTIAGLPLKLEKRRIVKKQIRNEVTGGVEEIEQAVWIDASGEKLFRRFECPNKYTTRAEFYMLVLIDLLTVGEYYVYLDSKVDLTTVSEDDSGELDPNSPFGRLRQIMAGDTPIDAMYRIPPTLIRPIPGENGVGLAGYYMQSDKGAFVFSCAEMVHVRLPNPINPLQGLSPLIAAFKPVLLDRFSTEHMIRFYKSGARLGGVIETEKTLNKEQLGRFQRTFENNFTGRANHHRTLILPPGMAYKQIEQNPAETALIEFCKYNRDAVLSAYRVPPIKAGVLDNANYANARVQLQSFFRDTIKPLLTFVEDGFNLKASLMPDGGAYRIKFDLSQEDALQEDYADKAKAAKDMLDAGLTVDEVRALVWDALPIEGGDKSPIVVRVTRDQLASFVTSPTPAGVPTTVDTADEVSATEAQEAIAENQITDPTLSLNGAQVTAMLDIVNRVAQGMLPRASGIEMIIAAFSVPRDAAERIMGSVGNGFTVDPQEISGVVADPAGVPVEPTEPVAEPVTPSGEAGKAVEQVDMPAISSDIKPTTGSFSDRVEQLTAQYMAEGMPLNLAIRKAIEQAKFEGFNPDDDGDDPKGGSTPPASDSGEFTPPQSTDEGKGANASDLPAPRQSLEEFVRSRLAEMGDTPVSGDIVASIVSEYQSSTGERVAAKTPERYGLVSKEKTTETWKNFVMSTHPLVERRLGEVQKFFKEMRSTVLNRIGANVKAYGLHKSRDEDDIDEILKLDAFDELLSKYIAEIDKTLLTAARLGFDETKDSINIQSLGEFQFGKPDEKAIEYLRKYAADKIEGIRDTTLEQMRAVLSDAFGGAEPKPIAEVAKAITDKFEEISSGRAQTIARTETLTAVSMGRELARQEVVAEFPEKKFYKVWVSAQDEVVRDSHQDLDGVSVIVDGEFKPGLKFPRDPDCDDPSEVINCRCTDLTYMEDDRALINESLPQRDIDEEG